MGQHVVQLAGDEQALLARATPGLLPRHVGPLGTPLQAIRAISLAAATSGNQTRLVAAPARPRAFSTSSGIRDGSQMKAA